MPVPFTATQMKAWLETGDLPTQQQFADIIDTLEHQDQQCLDTAADALTAATAAVAAATHSVIVRARFNKNNTANGVIFSFTDGINVSEVKNITSGANGVMRITFTTARPNVYYTVAAEGLLIAAINPQLGYVEFTSTGGLGNYHVYIRDFYIGPPA